MYISFLFSAPKPKTDYCASESFTKYKNNNKKKKGLYESYVMKFEIENHQNSWLPRL